MTSNAPTFVHPLKPPRDCTFTPGDWHALAQFWCPVAFVDEVPTDKPIARTLLDEQLVLYRSGESIVMAKDLCFHRGAPPSLHGLGGGQ
ncbi:MAG: Rieske 2Fe-2S domain-containing protein [Candidatus Synoicihabitans palmerolidicus]|nr:Rieske 2Fe-2S domain-containing protein [Candidatus Synoicihabitans palmerolidicus]